MERKEQRDQKSIRGPLCGPLGKEQIVCWVNFMKM